MAKLPELLAPAGSPRALLAAIEGGADAVYFGGSAFNARIGAENFTPDSIKEHIKTAHAYGVKCYMTLNTLVTDRELPICIETAADAVRAGVDAFIVADMGLAAALRRAFPETELHASTQASGHSKENAAELKKLGFSRMVMAREASLSDIREFTSSTDMELEVFVHGALCVSHSGQCLFSSLVGGRSGNRGECAQPCRLPFSVKGRDAYPLSLKDLSLAAYVPELIDAKVSSLKIEGRMKPPEYVLAVTRVWRRLLDENRGATPDEIKYLAEIFSRGGFTDGYFGERINRSMLGVRSESDKKKTRELPPFDGLKRKINIGLTANIKRGKPVTLTLTGANKTVTVTGDTPSEAVNTPMKKEDYAKNLLKFGATPYFPEKYEINADEGLILPVSRLNALRREAVEEFSREEAHDVKINAYEKEIPSGKRESIRTARFLTPSQITASAREYFDLIYLPLERYDGSVKGIIMPPVVFDKERERVKTLLKRAKEQGATDILIGNTGHLSLARELGFKIHGDFRLNITNSGSAATYEKLGFADHILSPELTLPQIRDIKGNGAVIVYGRVPLMTLEKCVIRELGPCQGYLTDQLCRGELRDRRGVVFPVFREGEHRNVVYNSLPTSMSDRQSDLRRFNVTATHFIFTSETGKDVERVIDAFKAEKPLTGEVRRIK